MAVTIPELGVRRKGKEKLPGHAMGFPSMMSSLKTFLGLEPRLGKCPDGGWSGFLWDLDYYFHLGVSTEGFGLFYDLPHAVLQGNLWEGEPLRDCFASEGIEYRLLADDTVRCRDGSITQADMPSVVKGHLDKGLPAIILYNKNLYLLAMGYQEDAVIAYPFADGSGSNKGFQIGKNAKVYHEWTEDAFAVITVDGLVTPAPRKGIIEKALRRGHEMLIEVKPNFHEYGYGDNLYTSWMGYLEDDGNYRTKKDIRKHISPEAFDFAERRLFTAEFLLEAEGYLGQGVLGQAITAFRDIHGNMMVINGMANDGKLLERETRLKVSGILSACKELDHKAAQNIGNVLGL